ncbi:hypothetical protein CLJ1_2522 [Pseudomonas paraeruginosa]|nr:hypothetical protein CLJ1_2522 [Pseudomonas aeruginosa]
MPAYASSPLTGMGAAPGLSRASFIPARAGAGRSGSMSV